MPVNFLFLPHFQVIPNHLSGLFIMLSKAGGVTGGAGGMGVGGAAGQAGGNLISYFIIVLIFSPWIAHEIIFSDNKKMKLK